MLLKPAHAVDEAVRPGQTKALESYASGTRWRRLGDHLFHDLKQNPVASFMLVDLLGFFFSLGIGGENARSEVLRIDQGGNSQAGFILLSRLA